jgi:dTDP-4-dehydrorhamnose reductase
MKPAILLTGKTGQVGFELHRLLPNIANLFAPDRNQLDLLHPATIRRILHEYRPQIVINAAAYTAVDAAERDEPAARATNSDAVGVLAEEAKKIGAAIVHYSTDYVFDGTHRTPYTESDLPNPLNVYGKTKLAGEELIRASGVPHLILRTSWVYATRGKNFLLTILRLASEKQELRVVADQIGSPTCAAEIARVTVDILERLRAPDGNFSLSDISGTYHASAAGETTWHEFAQAILANARSASRMPWIAAATQGRPLVTQKLVAVSTAEYASATTRPLYSVLSNARLQQTFGLSLPTWRDQLDALFRART